MLHSRQVSKSPWRKQGRQKVADLRYWPFVSHTLLKAGPGLKSPVKKVGAEKISGP